MHQPLQVFQKHMNYSYLDTSFHVRWIVHYAFMMTKEVPPLEHMTVPMCTYAITSSCVAHYHHHLLHPIYRGKRIPGPPNEWPFGFVWQVRELRSKNIWYLKSKELFQRYGKIIGFRVFCK